MSDNDKTAEQVAMIYSELRDALERIEAVDARVTENRIREAKEVDDKIYKLLSAIDAVDAKVNVLTRWVKEHDEFNERLMSSTDAAKVKRAVREFL